MRRIPQLSGLARLVIVAIIAFLFPYLLYKSGRALAEYQWGAVALASLWLVIWLLTGRLNPFRVVIGEDGRPSTSKLKPFLWTVVIVFTYAVLYAARVKKGYIEAIAEIPANLLIAIGFDAATLVAAKSITQSQVSSGQIEKPPPADPAKKTASTTTDTVANDGPGAVFQDDKGFPELTKIQTVTWTVFAIVIYLVAVNVTLHQIGAVPDYTPGGPPFPSNLGLPDIAPALMVLIGLGNAAYLGKKLVTTDTPVLTAMSVERKGTELEITITGVGFGATQNGSRITLNDKEIDRVPLEWTNERVKFRLPETNPERGDWISGQAIRVGLFVRGQTTNQLTLTIEPFLNEISPNAGAKGSSVSLTGTTLGATPGKVTIDDSEVEATLISSWSNKEIKFSIPPKHPSGAEWKAAQRISVGVIVQNKQSNKLGFTVT